MEDALKFYGTRYDLLGSWILRPGEKVMLGNPAERMCRFCGNDADKRTFKLTAHAIPESLGNKSIESAYECDTCNRKFGLGIENDLGNWSKPMRTFARIRGKKGVPTLKKGGESPGWRIEYSENNFDIKQYEHDPIFEVDHDEKLVTFTLRRDIYTPVAVLKAFVKIGLTLMPEEEIKNFQHLLTWLQDDDHSRHFFNDCTVIYSFRPGPSTADLLAAAVLRRKKRIDEIVPYSFLILSYGSEVFQVPLLSAEHDAALNGESIQIPPFPTPSKYGAPKTRTLNFTGREPVSGDKVKIVLGFETLNRVVTANE